jgi:hypothetical protein
MSPRHVALILVAGAATLFIWETLSNAALPWHRMTMRTFPDSTAAVSAIRAQAPANGLYYDDRGVVAAVAFLPDMSSRAALLTPMMLRQIVLDLVVAAIFLLAMARLPRATPLQYAGIFAVAALGISLSTFVSNWNWWGYPAAWTAVQVVDRAIGFALMGLVMGLMAHRAMPRSTTDEWGGVRAQGNLPTATGNSSARR